MVLKSSSPWPRQNGMIEIRYKGSVLLSESIIFWSNQKRDRKQRERKEV